MSPRKRKKKIEQRDFATCSHSDEITTNSYFGLSRPSYFKVMHQLCLYFVENGWNQVYQSRKKLAKTVKFSQNTVHNALCLIKKLGLVDSERSSTTSGKVGGSAVSITITDKGRIWYEDFQVAMNKKHLKEAKEDLKLEEEFDETLDKETHRRKITYTQEDKNVALFWFKNLKRYYKDDESHTIFNKLNWEKEEFARCNTIRYLRENLGYDNEKMMKILENASNDDFFMRNAYGAEKLKHKWKNGLTVMENMCQRLAEHNKKAIEEENRTIDQEKDRPFQKDVFNKEGNEKTEKFLNDFDVIWDSFFEFFGDRFKSTYKSVEDAQDSLFYLVNLCSAVYWMYRLYGALSNINYKSVETNEISYKDPKGHLKGYWYYLEQELKEWNPETITVNIAIKYWLQFCDLKKRTVNGEGIDDSNREYFDPYVKDYYATLIDEIHELAEEEHEDCEEQEEVESNINNDTEDEDEEDDRRFEAELMQRMNRDKKPSDNPHYKKISEDEYYKRLNGG